MGASGLVTAFTVAGSCLTPLMTVGGFRLPSFRMLFTLLIVHRDITRYGDDDEVGHHGHLAGAAWGTLYYLSFLRKPRSVACLRRQA